MVVGETHHFRKPPYDYSYNYKGPTLFDSIGRFLGSEHLEVGKTRGTKPKRHPGSLADLRYDWTPRIYLKRISPEEVFLWMSRESDD